MPKIQFSNTHSKCADNTVVRHLAQRQNHSTLRDRLQFLDQELTAGVDFDRYRFVLWRQALHRVGHRAVHQHKIITWVPIRCRGKSEFMQRLLPENPGVISRKRTARRVGSVQSGRQSYNEQRGS